MPPRVVLFHRDLRFFTGGHLKVWDYFNHFLACSRFYPLIYFTPTSREDINPWRNLPPIHRTNYFALDRANLLFLAGMDWQVLPSDMRDTPPVPVINLIQGLGHARAKDPLYAFLAHPAVRICVSPQVAEAILSTGRVNGPVITIPNGIDPALLPHPIPPSRRPLDLLIVGIKRPDFALELEREISSSCYRIQVLLEPLPRRDFLTLLAESRIALFLPFPKEGFYLPALEAMFLNTLVICPDCIGNQSFCLSGETCLSPTYQLYSLLDATWTALSLPPERYHAYLDKARRKARFFTLARERNAFLQVLDEYFPSS